MKENQTKQVWLLVNVFLASRHSDHIFLRDMPRLAVDIDLSCVEVAARQETVYGINTALVRSKERSEGLRSSMRNQHKENVCKFRLDERAALKDILEQ